MSNQYQEFFGMFLLTLALVASAIAWNEYWIKPHDEFMFAVMSCIEETPGYHSLSEENYTRCATEVRGNLGR
jgi:hypothetical protein